jgi:hypothetical protein
MLQGTVDVSPAPRIVDQDHSGDSQTAEGIQRRKTIALKNLLLLDGSKDKKKWLKRHLFPQKGILFFLDSINRGRSLRERSIF